MGYRQLVEKKEFPERTPVEDIRPLRFVIERPLDYYFDGDDTLPPRVGRWKQKLSALLRGGMGARSQKDVIEFLDPSGEYFFEPERLKFDTGIKYRESLLSCDGLICFVDPVRKDGSAHYFPLLFHNFAMLARLMRGEGNPGPLPVPVAVCVTKADQFAELEPEGADAEAFLQSHMGAVDFSVFRNFCDDVRFFATTAIGTGNVKEIDTRFVPIDVPNPRNVLEPIEWLISKGARPR
jgi:hypothetical protein